MQVNNTPPPSHHELTSTSPAIHAPIACHSDAISPALRILGDTLFADIERDWKIRQEIMNGASAIESLFRSVDASTALQNELLRSAKQTSELINSIGAASYSCRAADELAAAMEFERKRIQELEAQFQWIDSQFMQSMRMFENEAEVVNASSPMLNLETMKLAQTFDPIWLQDIGAMDDSQLPRIDLPEIVPLAEQFGDIIRDELKKHRRDLRRAKYQRNRHDSPGASKVEREITRERTFCFVYFVNGVLGNIEDRFETVHPHVFVKRGAMWWAGVNGDVRPIKSSKGLEYIAYALARSGQPLVHIDVFDGVNPQEQFEKTIGDDPLATTTQIQAVKRRYAQLQEDLSDAEEDGLNERAETIREELEQLEDCMSSIVGLGGRSRLIPDRNRRAKESVTRAIKRTLEQLKAFHPTLCEHLKKYLRVTPLLVYQPDTPIDWEL